MTNLEKAINNLSNHTISLYKDNISYFSDKKGISPMICFINEGINLNGFAVADIVVGKAVAMLFAYAGINKVYAKTISKPALEFLNNNKIYVKYDNIAEYIINRKGDGMCIMEKEVINDDNPNIAYIKLKAKLESMYGNNY